MNKLEKAFLSYTWTDEQLEEIDKILQNNN